MDLFRGQVNSTHHYKIRIPKIVAAAKRYISCLVQLETDTFDTYYVYGPTLGFDYFYAIIQHQGGREAPLGQWILLCICIQLHAFVVI